MSQDARTKISEMAGSSATLLHAADFGWVHRARFYWGNLGCGDSEYTTDEYSWHPAGTVIQDTNVMRWRIGPRPGRWWPTSGEWVFKGQGGFRAPAVPGSTWTLTYPSGRFLTLTTCFPHPLDRGWDRVDQATRDRFLADGRRFPVPHYVEHNLVQDNGELRTFTADEREALHATPVGYTRGLAGARGEEDARAHAIGNGFHVPSIVLLLAVTFRTMVRASASSACWPTSTAQGWAPATECEEWANAHVTGTLWDWEAALPTDITPDVLVDGVVGLFPNEVYPEDMVEKARRTLEGSQYTSSGVRGFCQGEGPPARCGGPGRAGPPREVKVPHGGGQAAQVARGQVG